MPHNVPSAPMQPFVPRHAPIRHEPGTSVYVRGLADEVCNCRLREVFQSYGSILQAKVILYIKQLIIMLKFFFQLIIVYVISQASDVNAGSRFMTYWCVTWNKRLQRSHWIKWLHRCRWIKMLHRSRLIKRFHRGHFVYFIKFFSSFVLKIIKMRILDHFLIIFLQTKKLFI